MDVETFMASQQYPDGSVPLTKARYAELLPGYEAMAHRAELSTVKRNAMMLAQVGAESGSLRWTEELADGTAYEGRVDLGNTHPGDGPRFKGRSFIQITGRHNYTRLSAWAHRQGLVPTSDYFVRHPEKLAEAEYVWLGPEWYWTQARPQMNSLADAGDIAGATQAVNGGYNNLSGRNDRWLRCLRLGLRLLPTVEEIDPMFIVYCLKKETEKLGKPWPGFFYTSGRQGAASEKLTEARLQALKAAKVPVRQVSYKQLQTIINGK